MSNIDDANVTESRKKEEGFMSSLWGSAKQNFSDLWNSINWDMDKQDINAKIGDINDAQTYHDDLLKIKDYYDLLNRKAAIEDKIYNDPNMSTRTREELDVLI